MNNTAEFEDKFFDIKKHKPQKNHVLVNYRATAELVDGADKRNVMELLYLKDKIPAALQYMRNVFKAYEPDVYRVPMEMIEDRLVGLTHEQVAQKPYKYTIDMFFYADPKDVPDDEHWSAHNIINNA